MSSDTESESECEYVLDDLEDIYSEFTSIDIYKKLCEPLIDDIKINYLGNVLTIQILHLYKEPIYLNLNVIDYSITSSIGSSTVLIEYDTPGTILLKKIIVHLYKQFIKPFTFKKQIRPSLIKLFKCYTDETEDDESIINLIYKYAISSAEFKFKPVKSYNHDLINELIKSTNPQYVPKFLSKLFDSSKPDIDVPTTSILDIYPEFFNKSMLELVPEQLFLYGLKFVISNLHAYCTQCLAYLPYALDEFTYCHREICKFQHINLALEQNLLTLLREKIDIIDIIFTLFWNYMNSTRIEMHFPSHLKLDSTDAKDIIALFQKIPAVSTMLHFKTNNDLKLHLGMELYLFIIWILTAFNLQLETDNEIISQLTNTTHTPTQIYRVCQYDAVHVLKFEAERQKTKVIRKMYHGSKVDCWFNILANGLQNLSNTKYMTTGQAYGQGIYVASDSGTARGYTMSFKSDWQHSTKSLNGKSLLLHLLLADPEQFKKTEGIYVVPSPNNLLITHLSIW